MPNFSRRVYGLSLLVALNMALAFPAVSAQERPTILFEAERAKIRGDRHILRLNDDASIIPAHRIVSLPIVDGRMGERVKLDNGLELYFPFGRIVEARNEFGKYRKSANGQTDLDPFFRIVQSFDKVLGQVCATTADVNGPGSRLDMRLGPNRTISMIHITPNPGVAPDDERIKVLTVSEFRWIKREPNAERLYTACQNNSGEHGAKVVAKE